MRYILVTYEENELPTTDYDLHERLGQWLADEGLECGVADFYSPQCVMEELSPPSDQLLFEIATSVEIISDNLVGIPESEEYRENIEAVWDELAHMEAKLDEALYPEKETEGWQTRVES